MSFEKGVACNNRTSAVYITGLGHEYPSHSIKQEHFMQLLEKLHPDEVNSPMLVLITLTYDTFLSSSNIAKVSKNSGDSMIDQESSLAQLPSTSIDVPEKTPCLQKSIGPLAYFVLQGYGLLPLRARRLCKKLNLDLAI